MKCDRVCLGLTRRHPDTGHPEKGQHMTTAKPSFIGVKETARPSGRRFVKVDHENKLLLITVLAYETDIESVYGTADAVRVDIVVLDGDGAPDKYSNTLLFGTVLVDELHDVIGSRVLGRLGKSGTGSAGRNPAWVLNPHTEADAQVATDYLA